MGRDQIDVACGLRIRIRRDELNWTQARLAGALGVTIQQLQKHESGANCVAASRLYELTRILDVPMSYFLEQHEPTFVDDVPDLHRALALEDVRTLNLAFLKIGDAAVRRAIVSLVDALGSPRRLSKDGEALVPSDAPPSPG